MVLYKFINLVKLLKKKVQTKKWLSKGKILAIRLITICLALKESL